MFCTLSFHCGHAVELLVIAFSPSSAELRKSFGRWVTQAVSTPKVSPQQVDVGSQESGELCCDELLSVRTDAPRWYNLGGWHVDL